MPENKDVSNKNKKNMKKIDPAKVIKINPIVIRQGSSVPDRKFNADDYIKKSYVK